MTQHMEALALANERRLGMATWRREIAAMDRMEAAGRMADLLEADELHDNIASLTIDRFLSAPRRSGADRVARFLRAAGIYRMTSTSRCRTDVRVRVRDLTRRERDGLAAALRAWGNRSA